MYCIRRMDWYESSIRFTNLHQPNDKSNLHTHLHRQWRIRHQVSVSHRYRLRSRYSSHGNHFSKFINHHIKRYHSRHVYRFVDVEQRNIVHHPKTKSERYHYTSVGKRPIGFAVNGSSPHR